MINALFSPNVDKSYYVEYVASNMRIGAILSQEMMPIIFFGEKLVAFRKTCSIYDKKLYALACSCFPITSFEAFVLLLEHEAMKIHKSQINPCASL